MTRKRINRGTPGGLSLIEKGERQNEHVRLPDAQDVAKGVITGRTDFPLTLGGVWPGRRIHSVGNRALIFPNDL